MSDAARSANRTSTSHAKPNIPNRSGPTRRHFLRASAGLLAGTAAGWNLARAAHGSGSDALKVGLIGCGGRGSGAAANALNADPGARLVAMADLFEDKVLGARKRLKEMKPEQVEVDRDRCFVGFDGYRQVIDSGVDVVVIACASRFHPEYLKAAVEAGKHVFVEKPHAIDPPGVQTVIAACEEAERKGLSVVSGLCWRYHTGVQETMKRVLDGAIGEIVAIQETYMRSPYRLIDRQPEQSEIEYQFRNWYHFNWLCGDDIAQSLIHSLDKGSWLLGDQPPLRAYGQGGRAASFGTKYGDVFDHHMVTYEYANGVRMYGIGRAQTGCYNEVSDIFLGTKGRCDLLKHRIEGETEWRYEGPACNMYDLEHVALFSAIRSGKPINNGRYMATSSMLAILGRMVCYTGKRMTWDEAMQSSHRLGPQRCSFDIEPPVKPDEKGIYPVPVPGMTTLG
ncbi:MAG TPA: Gfo/Idh/MocA family oxidoreductase [Planctomycetaceae bacterium]|nr:Gfo/Idh/MocA family oxidoreductase [Planctomycetaceae bacterium]